MIQSFIKYWVKTVWTA